MEGLEETKYAIIKSGVFTGGLYLKSKKTYYALLRNCVLEIYKSSKGEKSGKKAKLLFDLSLAFSVHLHYDAVLKDCIALMMPDETFLMRFEMESDFWFEMLIDRACQARSAKLSRPVYRNEYFEVAWDVEPIRKPKLSRKIRDEEPVEDLVVKNESFFLGKKRLCMYPHTLYVVRKGVIANKDTSPPFCSDDYIAFPVSAISIYGHHNKYFFFRAGRCAPTGAGELWFCTDNGETASSIIDKIIKICERENEKKKVLDRMYFSRSNVSTRSFKSQAHRERSHTHTQRSSTDAASVRSFGRKLSATGPGFSGSYFSQQSVLELPAVSGSSDPLTRVKSSSGKLRQVDVKFLHSHSTIDDEEKERQRLTNGCNRFSEETSQISSRVLDGYTQMGCAQDCSYQSTSASNLNYTLAEVQSYMSNSSNCFDSMKLSGGANNGISGSRSLPCCYFSQVSSYPFTIHSDVFDNVASKNLFDPRKRAHSLGSKSWVKVLRKVADLCIEHTNGDRMRQQTNSFGSSDEKKTKSFSSHKAGLPFQRNQQADDLTEWDFDVPVVGRSGSSSATSEDSSSRSRTSSLDIGSSMVLYSAIKNVRKGRNDFENLFEKIRSAANLEQGNNSKLLPTNDNEYILPPFDSFVTKNSAKMTGNTSNRWIGTILERNTSSGSSSSHSPVSFKEKSSNGNNEAKVSSLSSETMKRSFVPRIAPEHDYERSVSDGAFVKDEQVDLEYATLHWVQSDTLPQSSLHATGGLIDKSYRKRCEYAVIQPHNS